VIAELIRAHAQARPHQAALIHDGRRQSFAELDQLADRVAAALQRDGVAPRDIVAIGAETTPQYVGIFLGCLRAGVAVAPLPMSFAPAALAAMICDAGPRMLFLDPAAAEALRDAAPLAVSRSIAMDAAVAGGFQDWLPQAGAIPARVEVQPEWPFNVIYSSGTTGVPKGIVQSHAFRAGNVRRAELHGYGPSSVLVLATPLYSNTTLATLFGALALGSTVVLLGKFDADDYLALVQDCRATHTMLVPVQYQRLLAAENFDRFDLSAFQMKFSTGAPFSRALKQEVLERWPGGLIEIYGMTEGGVTCALHAHKHPNKLHTVGTPMPGHELRLIGADDREIGAGESGEIVGHSPAMMTCYLNQPAKTREAEWYDSGGRRFIRTGDIGRLDADGFLVLLDRKKDVIISGGFNIYPSDLEAVLRGHPAVADAAVVGMASSHWGETPLACVVLRDGAMIEPADLCAWANERLGKMQRISAVKFMARLPHSAAGKVLKGELRAALG
jgi:long-chain acyl-CoA synthetase